MEFMTSLQGGLDEQKPSLFELLSEQQLAALIPPSLRYLLAIATQRHPRYLLRILNSFDEVYAILSLIIERHYLKTYSGSFTENFYNLKRARVLRVKSGEVPRASLGAPEQVRETIQLTNKDIWANLLTMVGLPYIKRKLDESYDIHAAHEGILGPQFQDRDRLDRTAPMRQKLLFYYKYFLRNIYPSVNAAYHFSLLAFQLSYLFDGTKYSSPFLYATGTRIRRLHASDHAAFALSSNPTPPAARPGQTTSLLSPRLLTQVLYPRALQSLKILLPTSIFALKFLEWWHASDFARQLSLKAAEGIELPVPTISNLPIPPPKPETEKKSGVTFTDERAEPSDDKDEKRRPPICAKTGKPILTVPPAYSSELCPICLKQIETPTASPSGFVFCYTCIFKWVDGQHEAQEQFMDSDQGGTGRWEDGRGRCAVTGKRILGGSGGLRRIMV